MMNWAKTLGEALLAPTKIYVKALKSIKNSGVKVKACSHITGGGFYENIPRMLHGRRSGLLWRRTAIRSSCQSLSFWRRKATLQKQMMYNTFNMGLGMVLAVRTRQMWTRQ